MSFGKYTYGHPIIHWNDDKINKFTPLLYVIIILMNL